MRITNICLLAPVTDGWNYQDNLLTKYQKKNGNDVTIITSHRVRGKDNTLHYDDREEYYNEDHVKVIRINMRGKEDFNNRFKTFPKLYEMIEKTKPEIIFIHGVSFKDTTAIKKYLINNPDVRAFADNHADFSNSATNWVSKNILHKIIWKYYAKKLIPVVETFYGVLPARVDFLTEMYDIPKSKCKLLPLGVDDDLADMAMDPYKLAEIRETFNINKDDFVIVTGGKIDAAKKQTFSLMKSINQLKDGSIKLLIFGSVVDDLKEEFELLLSENVQYIGWANNEESYLYLSMADLVIFPGRHSVYWEQSAGLGKPLVVKYWTGTNHIDLDGNVIFLKNDSVEEIKYVIESLINNPYKLNYMKKHAMRAKRYFSYKQIAKNSIK